MDDRLIKRLREQITVGGLSHVFVGAGQRTVITKADSSRSRALQNDPDYIFVGAYDHRFVEGLFDLDLKLARFEAVDRFFEKQISNEAATCQ
jgi:hypothetical protein